MVRTRSPVRIWLSAPKKTSLTTGGVFFGAGGISVKSTPNKEECFFLPLCFISLENVPYNEGCFFELGASPSKALPIKRSAFFFRCVSSPSKTFLTTRDVFLELGASPSKALPTKRSAFFFRCVSFSSKNKSKNLDLNYLPSGLFSKTPVLRSVFL